MLTKIVNCQNKRGEEIASNLLILVDKKGEILKKYRRFNIKKRQ